MKLSSKQATMLSRAIGLAVEPDRKYRSESLRYACVRLVLEGGFGAENAESETRSALKRAEEVRDGICRGRIPQKEEPKKEEPKKEEPKKEEPKKEEPKK